MLRAISQLWSVRIEIPKRFAASSCVNPFLSRQPLSSFRNFLRSIPESYAKRSPPTSFRGPRFQKALTSGDVGKRGVREPVYRLDHRGHVDRPELAFAEECAPLHRFDFRKILAEGT